jgi:hypothetical protein
MAAAKHSFDYAFIPVRSRDMSSLIFVCDENSPYRCEREIKEAMKFAV